MSEPDQLHLPHIPIPAPPAGPDQQHQRDPSFAGLSRAQIAASALIIGAAVWGIWVTKTLVTPAQDHIVSVRLSAIVGEYVQAQARAATPPDKVEIEMRHFMATLDKEMQRRANKGEIVIVGEAVLSRNVPDITDSIKKAVYASGVAFPKQTSAVGMQSPQRRVIAEQATIPTTAPAPVAMTAMDSATGLPAPSPFANAPMTGATGDASAPAFGGTNGPDSQ
ncbi:Type-F conjugative transfer system protein (TrbI_Ftype) [Sphingobium sp. AP50]|uniref:TrbI F-type domain-containing protein n=1 Tax=Sphingobium sp. AP50 TaxID=1884369 RepID=UPI0008ABB1AD|nr:TrbI F-type domain-containing protein [Sphingobium sp. AP50]SEK04135.1 Type-F conjugative transfer system protein (TrbI_Ftype) [Sphingobium sp. AP50]